MSFSAVPGGLDVWTLGKIRRGICGDFRSPPCLVSRVPTIALMAAAQALSVLSRTVRESGLVREGSRGVVLVSGGADSAAIAAGLVGALQDRGVIALHLHYQLRPHSKLDH